MLPAGAVLFSSRAPIGHVAINTIPMCTNQGFKSFVPDVDRVSPDYLYYWLRANKKYLQSLGNGATFKEVSKTTVEEVRLPLPCLSEQRRIAAILDKADALRAKRREAIAKLDQLLQSVFLDMFGDPITNPKGWPEARLDAVCSKIIDCPHSTPNWSESGVVCLRTSNLGKGDWNWADTRYVTEREYVERSQRGEIEPGDVVLSREGTIGVLAVVGVGMRLCMGQRLVQLRANVQKATPHFLMNLLLHDLAPERISRLMAGSTSRHLNVKELKGLPVNIPPLSQQQQFSAISEKIQQQKRTLERHCTQSDNLFASLQHRAFSGTL